MLNASAKEASLSRLQTHVERYETLAEDVRRDAVILFEKRQGVVHTVLACEQYLTHLANAPRELKKAVGELRTNFDSFAASVIDLEKQAKEVTVNSGSGAVAGTLTGVGVAAFGPTAAMAIATTFGTAGTGTAISTLSGAAATNAALAWLGGGAIAAGGGGMAAGNALLALAGPVGWAIGGVALLGAGGYAWYRNSEIAEEAQQKTEQVIEKVHVLEAAQQEVEHLAALTDQHNEGLKAQLRHLQAHAPDSYLAFSEEDKLHLGALINNAQSLGALIIRQINF